MEAHLGSLSARRLKLALLVTFFAAALRVSLPAQITLQFRSAGTNADLRWRSLSSMPVSSMYSEYVIQHSTNLANWQPLAGVINGGVGVSDEQLRFSIPRADPRAFYRVVANTRLAAESIGGDGVFGYGTEFSREISALGQLPLAQFSSLYGVTNLYLHQITWNPTNAAYWDAFNADPVVWNITNTVDPRLYDFRMNANEFSVFRTNGFVVSERLGTYSFADSFYRIFSDDLPVFVSADGPLHAWHRSYVTILEELEETYLALELKAILDAMAVQVPGAWQAVGQSDLANSVLDADLYLAVARSLVNGSNVPTYLGQDTKLASTLSAINSLQLQPFELFGATRWVDFSQFQVRGHYDASLRLSNYFRASMWTGRIDFRVADNPGGATERELGASIVLNDLLSRAGPSYFSRWQQFDDIIQLFVGPTDSMTFAQLRGILAAANIQSLADVSSLTALRQLQTNLLAGQYGVQNIAPDLLVAPFGPQQLKLPRSFTVFGQKFVMDSWAFSKVVFDSIIWDDDGVLTGADKVRRRIPSALDTAFSVLGNNQIVPELVSRMTSTNGRAFRDGLPYQHNLSAVRNVLDRQSTAVWTNNIYTSWLHALRALSPPTTDPQYPEALRTRAWAHKTLNTQLASWTELRHDTVLYARQSSTPLILCSYPAGFVEPRPEFWRRMRLLALRTKALTAGLPAVGTVQLAPRDNPPGTPITPITADIGTIQTNRQAFLQNFADKMATLQAISEKELAQQPLSAGETTFLRDLIQHHDDPYLHTRLYSGWYPGLFYRSVFQQTAFLQMQGSDIWDALVTDVHTDGFDELAGDPGMILHEGVGYVHLLLIAVDNGPDRMMYAGPVMSHYEFEMPLNNRKTDAQWKAQLQSGQHPPQPEWTRSFLVPGP